MTCGFATLARRGARPLPVVPRTRRLNVNRRVLTAWLAGALLVCAQPARSQSLGQFGGAAPLPMNSKVISTFVDASSHEVGFVTQLRLSYYPDVDFGFQGGVKRLDYTDAGGNA